MLIDAKDKDSVKFVHLDTIDKNKVINLMTNKKVGEQMPLLANGFSEEMYDAFISAKKKLWEDHGYGPWAFIINDHFAGWGGLQYEQGYADFALVLHPDYWGWGRVLFYKILDQAVSKHKLNSITILFPPSRKNWRAITRLGFKPFGEFNVGGYVFTRFILNLSELQL